MKFIVETDGFSFQELFETMDHIISVIQKAKEFNKNKNGLHSPIYSPSEPLFHQNREKKSPSGDIYQKVNRQPRKLFPPFSPKAKKEELAFSPYSPIKYT